MTHAQFILSNTRLLAVPLVPELRLHLAEESLAIWRQTEEELGRMNVPPPWWAFAWAGGQALARYVLDNPALAAGRRVLDLGAGSGLGGIAAMKAGAARVLAADTDRFATMAAIRLNAAANDVALEATGDDLLATPPSGFDLVLVGDLFYERTLAERVLACIEAVPHTGCRSARRRSAPQLLPQGALRARGRVLGARDARPGGYGDQAHLRVAFGIRPAAVCR